MAYYDGARWKRNKKTLNCYESSIDHTYRKPERETEGGRVLLPEVQRATDRATMSAEMGGHTGSEGSTGTVRGEVWTEETGTVSDRDIKAGQTDEKLSQR